jgi:hypothetical protein
MDRPLMLHEIHAELVSWMRRRAVFICAKLPQGAVDRGAYAVRVLEKPHRAQNRRDVFAPSNRWTQTGREGWRTGRGGRPCARTYSGT